MAPCEERALAREVVCIEGNIGAGKSTLLRNLVGLLPGSVAYVPEPVDLWEDCGALPAYYAGRLPSVAFQLVALVTRDAAWRLAAGGGASLLVCERSVESDRGVFAESLLQGADRRIYEAAHGAVLRTRPTLRTLTVLVDLPVKVLEQRVRGRHRASEVSGAGAVGRELLERLATAHARYYEGLRAADRVRVCGEGDELVVARRVAREIVRWRAEAASAGAV